MLVMLLQSFIKELVVVLPFYPVGRNGLEWFGMGCVRALELDSGSRLSRKRLVRSKGLSCGPCALRLGRWSGR